MLKKIKSIFENPIITFTYVRISFAYPIHILYYVLYAPLAGCQAHSQQFIAMRYQMHQSLNGAQKKRSKTRAQTEVWERKMVYTAGYWIIRVVSNLLNPKSYYKILHLHGERWKANFFIRWALASRHYSHIWQKFRLSLFIQSMVITFYTWSFFNALSMHCQFQSSPVCIIYVILMSTKWLKKSALSFISYILTGFTERTPIFVYIWNHMTMFRRCLALDSHSIPMNCFTFWNQAKKIASNHDWWKNLITLTTDQNAYAADARKLESLES